MSFYVIGYYQYVEDDRYKGGDNALLAELTAEEAIEFKWRSGLLTELVEKRPELLWENPKSRQFFVSADVLPKNHVLFVEEDEEITQMICTSSEYEYMGLVKLLDGRDVGLFVKEGVEEAA